MNRSFAIDERWKFTEYRNRFMWHVLDFVNGSWGVVKKVTTPQFPSISYPVPGFLVHTDPNPSSKVTIHPFGCKVWAWDVFYFKKLKYLHQKWVYGLQFKASKKCFKALNCIVERFFIKASFDKRYLDRMIIKANQRSWKMESWSWMNQNLTLMYFNVFLFLDFKCIF